MPSDRYLKVMNGVHKGLLRLSGGRFGWTAMDMPVLELTTTGRRSGRPRSVMLTSPHREGERIVIVASKGGEDSHPAWFLNLRENPQVTVSMKDAPDVPMTARVASLEQRDWLWSIVSDKQTRYVEYQEKTDREIPLVLLEPLT
ncbi:MAG: nitroreductase family deazaflavin-dependent oxidoreductase [Vicinamibacterales bacterium]|nr:nitroreductase family deazaflavin-dependent oxidoreductase [Vicinamibacterales bacterium]|tara:strand:- start:1192 stop:1623 length:432 start_codon:yes stop_codon:yes gene_type:complete